MSDLTKEQREEMDIRWATDTFELANLLSLAADDNVSERYLGNLVRGYATALARNLVKLRCAQTEALSSINLHDLHSALEPFAMMALHSRDEWRKDDGSMHELGVPRDCMALIEDYPLTQGQLNDVEKVYEAVERILKSNRSPPLYTEPK